MLSKPLFELAKDPIGDERSREILLEMLQKEKVWLETFINDLKKIKYSDQLDDIIDLNIRLRECNECIETVTNYKFE